MDKRILICFNSTHYAISGEKLLKQKGYGVDIIPTPRDIMASCGLSIMMEEQPVLVEKILKENDINYQGIYNIVQEGFKKKFTKI